MSAATKSPAAGFSITHKLAAAEGATITVTCVREKGVRMEATGVPLLVAGLLAGAGPLDCDKADSVASDLRTVAALLEQCAEVLR